MQEKTSNSEKVSLIITGIVIGVLSGILSPMTWMSFQEDTQPIEKETNYKYVIGFNKNGDVVSRDSLTLQDIEYIDTRLSIYKTKKQIEWLEKELK